MKSFSQFVALASEKATGFESNMRRTSLRFGGNQALNSQSIKVRQGVLRDLKIGERAELSITGKNAANRGREMREACSRQTEETPLGSALQSRLATHAQTATLAGSLVNFKAFGSRLS